KTSKNVLITGVSTGIGFELAKVFVANGFLVFGSVRKKEDAKKVGEELGNNFQPLIFDVTDHEAVDTAASALYAKIKEEGLACLINNAGIVVPVPLFDLSVDDFRHQFEVNVFGAIKVTQAFLPLLGASESRNFSPGKIIQISSVSGRIGMPFLSPYVGSKHALEGISDCLRRELLQFGIDVIVIQPGPVETPIWKKSEESPTAKYFEKSLFRRALEVFQHELVPQATRRAYSADFVAETVFKIFSTPKPKTRYALVPQRFQNWTVHSILPARFIDKIIGKKLKNLPR
ncbi:MAG: SDR family oxidoreductase, partial [Bacteroidota bacterium]